MGRTVSVMGSVNCLLDDLLVRMFKKCRSLMDKQTAASMITRARQCHQVASIRGIQSQPDDDIPEMLTSH